MGNMRILMQNRTEQRQAIAGDTIQVARTRETLRRLQVEVDFNSSFEADLSNYDLIHLFNLIPVEHTYKQAQNALRQKKPFVLSTVFWDPGEYLENAGGDAAFDRWWNETMPMRRFVMENAALILPNSMAELASLRMVFKTAPLAEIVPNAADHFFCHGSPDRFFRKYRKRDFLLGVGRICRRKNQLRLIEASRKLGLPLVLIGPVNDGIYYQECRHMASGAQVLFIDTFSPRELADAYASARVHALVSWYDTPGLVSLEAALAGCRIVSTDRGSAREYLGEYAFYCDPSQPQNIVNAIAAAWDAKPRLELKQRILSLYSWEKAAHATCRAYRRVLK